MSKTIILATAFLIGLTLYHTTAGQESDTAVRWLTIEEAEKLAKENPKPLFVDTYTDWCSWCRKLDKDTFSNPVIADMLNTMFYPVKFNAESKEEVTFQGVVFTNDGSAQKAHQLAVALLQGKLSYPSVVFFNDKLQLLTAVPGYRTAKDMEPLLRFFAEEVYEQESFEEYMKTFSGKIR